MDPVATVTPSDEGPWSCRWPARQ